MRTSITQRADPIGVTIKQAFGHKVLWMVGIGRKRRQIELACWGNCQLEDNHILVGGVDWVQREI